MVRLYLLAVILILWSAGIAASLKFSSPALEFSDVEVGEQKTLEFSVTNELNRVNVIQLNLGGFSHNEFRLDLNTITLSAGETKKVQVNFTPYYNIEYTGKIIFISNQDNDWQSLAYSGNGRIESYYSATFNLFDLDLINALKSSVSNNYRNLGYSGARDAMYASIDNVNGKVECVYTGRKASFTTRSGANNNSFNCEHSFPQSKFNKREPERADIHHLFPTDVSANSRRGSDPFEPVSNPSWEVGGSKSGQGLFEPRDAQKGATARAMLYFAIRYQDYEGFANRSFTSLKRWHRQHPPSTKDSLRNEAIFSVQKNRNPFVDHPEFIDRFENLKGTVSNSMALDLPTDTLFILMNGTGQFFIRAIGKGTTNADYSITGDGLSLDNPPTSVEPGTHLIQYTVNKPNDLPSFGTITITNSLGDNLNISYKMVQSALGVKENTLDWKLYPNPVNHFLNFNANISLKKVELVGLGGVRMELTDTLNSLNEYELPNLPNGIYFVEVYTTAGVMRKRLIVQQP